ncbi:MAG: hypothetical protein RSE41_05985 [Clostridia bacterium]
MKKYITKDEAEKWFCAKESVFIEIVNTFEMNEKEVKEKGVMKFLNEETLFYVNTPDILS